MFHVQITPKVSEPPHRRLEWEYDLSSEELEQRFLTPYCRGKPIVIRGRIIAMDELHRIRIYETDEKIGHLTNKPSYKMADVTNEFIIGPPGYEVDESNTTTQQPHSNTSMKIFISHSSEDVEIAKPLIDLLRKALQLRSNEIRCTSVDGYRMQGGASIDERLRAEVHDAELLVGFIRELYT